MDLGDIHVGSPLLLDGQSYVVVAASHAKQGRGGAVVKAKLKNLQTQAVIDRTIKPGDNFEEADVSRVKASYLYQNGSTYAFMDSQTFEQFELSATTLGDQVKWLLEGMEVTVLLAEGKAVAVELPIKAEYEVQDAPPGVKGNTAQGGTKLVTLGSGATVSVPLFIKKGDIIRVNTTDGSYVERAK